jgi:hypothetical protein
MLIVVVVVVEDGDGIFCIGKLVLSILLVAVASVIIALFN